MIAAILIPAIAKRLNMIKKCDKEKGEIVWQEEKL